jgi:hypothetical protein
VLFKARNSKAQKSKKCYDFKSLCVPIHFNGALSAGRIAAQDSAMPIGEGLRRRPMSAASSINGRILRLPIHSFKAGKSFAIFH